VENVALLLTDKQKKTGPFEGGPHSKTQEGQRGPKGPPPFLEKGLGHRPSGAEKRLFFGQKPGPMVRKNEAGFGQGTLFLNAWEVFFCQVHPPHF